VAMGMVLAILAASMFLPKTIYFGVASWCAYRKQKRWLMHADEYIDYIAAGGADKQVSSGEAVGAVALQTFYTILYSFYVLSRGIIIVLGFLFAGLAFIIAISGADYCKNVDKNTIDLAVDFAGGDDDSSDYGDSSANMTAYVYYVIECKDLPGGFTSQVNEMELDLQSIKDAIKGDPESPEPSAASMCGSRRRHLLRQHVSDTPAGLTDQEWTLLQMSNPELAAALEENPDALEAMIENDVPLSDVQELVDSGVMDADELMEAMADPETADALASGGGGAVLGLALMDEREMMVCCNGIDMLLENIDDSMGAVCKMRSELLCDTVNPLYTTMVHDEICDNISINAMGKIYQGLFLCSIGLTILAALPNKWFIQWCAFYDEGDYSQDYVPPSMKGGTPVTPPASVA